MDSPLFNSLFEQSVIAMSIKDVKTRKFHYINQTLVNFTGYEKEKLIGSSFELYSHPDEIKKTHCYLDKLKNGELSSFQLEKRFLHRNGQVLWGILSVNIIYHQDGSPQYFLAQIQDITEQKQMELQLIESEKKYRLIAENSSDLISIYSLDGEFRYMSASVKSQLGYKEDELLKMNPFTLFHPDDIERVMEQNKLLLRSKEPFTITYRKKHKDGHYIWFESEVSLIYENGLPKEVLVMSRDVTERKKVEMQLLQSEQRYRNLVELSPEAIAVSLDERIVYMNPAGIKLVGAVSPKEVIGQSIWNFFDSKDIPDICNKVALIQSGVKKTIKIRKTCNRLDHTPVAISAAISQIIFNGKPAIQAVIRDITEQKKMEDWMRKTEKLSLVGQLAAGVAHEVRNPMTSIKGFIQLAKISKEWNESYIDIMLNELSRMETIIYEFLTLAKPSEHLNFVKKNFHTILQQVISLLETQALIRDVTIHAELEEQIFVECDENQMKQVFINIIQNAIEASNKKGTIFISLIRIGTEKIIVQIVDEGQGIPKDRLDKLGEPFYSTKEKGTGLGLLVSYKIIEAHRGSINFTSEVAKGTLVEITLPISQSKKNVIIDPSTVSIENLN